jgi:hypothetical protein
MDYIITISRESYKPLKNRLKKNPKNEENPVF